MKKKTLQDYKIISRTDLVGFRAILTREKQWHLQQLRTINSKLRLVDIWIKEEENEENNSSG